jgi:steroid 5-alpha reductase family enzyme
VSATHDFLFALGVTCGMGIVTWLISLAKRDVSIVDSLWSLLFLAAAGVFVFIQTAPTTRAWIMLALVAAWALRLCIYITARNHGHGEDIRYQVIRKNNQRNFEFKSLYIVFLFQAVLASIVSLPLLAVAHGTNALTLLDYVGIAIVIFGTLFEAIGDWQLSRFKADPNNQGRVMDQGLWRYTRHPNYFGECCVWWGFYLIAIAAGGWWSIAGPLVMTGLLLKVSGVALLEKAIVKRRPEYVDYIKRTNAFIPGPRKNVETEDLKARGSSPIGADL